jgi:predicted lactoylglutathione lyase
VKLPHPVPELPVADIQQAGNSYARHMGFKLDWVYQDLLAGISRDDTRIFLRRRTPQEAEDRCSVTVWLNMASKAEVDELFAEWKGRGVLMVDELKTADYNLREFTVQDLDGNRLRVFYDLGSARG